jgi:hypothetical protein
MASVSKAATIADYQALSTGLGSVFSPTFAFLFASKLYTTPEVEAAVNAALTSAITVTTAESALRAARLADMAVQAQYAGIIKELRQFIAIAYSNDAATLAKLGMTPRKTPKPLSTAAKAAKEAKARATREARGTASKKAKAAIKGAVTGVQIVPVTAAGGSSSGSLSTVSPALLPTSASPATPAPSAPTTPVVSIGPVATGTARS